ncbi:hypothetical protein BGW80DRAFT_1346717 [Lactifluus volemus]|nr:hypothetical protein BGW80DRAFT_1346717 [Lactifluus volemus]
MSSRSRRSYASAMDPFSAASRRTTILFVSVILMCPVCFCFPNRLKLPRFINYSTVLDVSSYFRLPDFDVYMFA